MGILAKIEEMRLRRLNKKLKKMSADNFSYLLSSGYFHDENYTGGKSRLLTDYFLEHEEEFRKEVEERVRNSPEYKSSDFQEECRKLGLEALLEVRRIGAEYHNPEGVVFCDKQRPDDYREDKQNE